MQQRASYADGIGFETYGCCRYVNAVNDGFLDKVCRPEARKAFYVNVGVSLNVFVLVEIDIDGMYGDVSSTVRVETLAAQVTVRVDAHSGTA